MVKYLQGVLLFDRNSPKLTKNIFNPSFIALFV